MEKYEPMDKVRKEFRVAWYRSPIAKEDLRRLTKRSNARGFLQTLGHLALSAAAIYLAFRFFHLGIWWAFGLSLWVYGISATFMGMAAIHEFAHNTVFTKKWLNTIFLWIFSTFGWFLYPFFKLSHTYHHLYTLHPRGDREVTLPKVPSLKFVYLLQLFTFNITGGFESIGLIPTMKNTFKAAFTGHFATAIGTEGSWLEDVFTPDAEPERKKAILFSWVLLVFHSAITAIAIVFRLWPLLVIPVGPFIANWLRYFVGVPMHTGLQNNVDDFRKCCRTITLGPISTFLYWRMNWHIEHHMFAAVPCYNLKRLHKTVAADMPEPRTLVGAWKEMRQTWKKQQDDPTYQFDTPVPTAADRPPEQQDPLEGAIGEIRPEALN